MRSTLSDAHADQLRFIINRVEAWIAERAALFDPYAWRNASERFLKRKAFNELCLYLHVVRRTEGHLPTALGAIHNQALDRVNDARYAQLILREQKHFLLYATPTLYAKSAGCLSTTTEAAIRMAVSLGGVWAGERQPHRYLDLWHFCTQFGLDAGGLDPNDLIQLGCVRRNGSFLDADLSEAYALTHSLFYWYNFGILSDRQAKAPDLPDDLSARLAGFTLRFLSSENLDITLELILAGALHRQIPRVVIPPVLASVHGHLMEDGFIPCPPAQHTDGLPDDAELLAWSASYHTMLVAGLTCRTLLRTWTSLEDRILAAPVVSVPDNELRKLGEALQAAADYDLITAAVLARLLLCSSVRVALPRVYEGLVTFLLAQQHAKTDHFGYLVDEAQMFACQRPESDFESEIHDVVDGACGELMAACKDLGQEGAPGILAAPSGLSG